MGKQGTKDYDPSNIGRRISGGDYNLNSKMLLLHGLKSHDFHVLRNDSIKYSTCKGSFLGKKHLWLRKDVKSIVFVFVLMGFLLLLDSFLVSFFDSMILQNSSTLGKSLGLKVREFIIVATTFPCHSTNMYHICFQRRRKGMPTL